MTPEEARITLLSLALQEAQNHVDFLHKCLMDKKMYSYKYPELTIKLLDSWKELIEPMPADLICVHSKVVEGCLGCQRRGVIDTITKEARQTLHLDPEPVVAATPDCGKGEGPWRIWSREPDEKTVNFQEADSYDDYDKACDVAMKMVHTDNYGECVVRDKDGVDRCRIEG